MPGKRKHGKRKHGKRKHGKRQHGKRKHGISAVQSINSIETIRKKRKKSQANQHVKKTVNKNKKKVFEIIGFFVKFALMTCLSVGSVNVFQNVYSIYIYSYTIVILVSQFYKKSHLKFYIYTRSAIYSR